MIKEYMEKVYKGENKDKVYSKVLDIINKVKIND